MQVIGFIVGCVSIAIWAVALIPFLGWINWLNLPLAAVGLILSIVGIVRIPYPKYFGVLGIVLNGIALLFGIIRLEACGGFI